MSANKNGNAPKKASVKRMHRPHRLENGITGQQNILTFLQRGMVIQARRIMNSYK